MLLAMGAFLHDQAARAASHTDVDADRREHPTEPVWDSRDRPGSPLRMVPQAMIGRPVSHSAQPRVTVRD